ncbi:unnamed protein product [Prunus armeniaca]
MQEFKRTPFFARSRSDLIRLST